MAHGRVAKKSRKGGEDHDEGSCAGCFFRIKPQPDKSRDNEVAPTHSQQSSKISGNSAHGASRTKLLNVGASNLPLFRLEEEHHGPGKNQEAHKEPQEGIPGNELGAVGSQGGKGAGHDDDGNRRFKND